MSQKTKSAKKTRWHIRTNNLVKIPCEQGVLTSALGTWHIRTNNLVKIPPYAVAFQDAYGDCEDVAWFHSSDSAAAFIAWREQEFNAKTQRRKEDKRDSVGCA